MKITKTTLLSTLLFLSIVGNLALTGMLTGRNYGGHEWRNHLSFRAIMRFADDLPAAERDAVHEAVGPERDGLKERFAAQREQRAQIRQLMQAPELDRQALEQAFARYREQNGETQAMMHRLTVEALMAMSPESRQRMLTQQKKPHDWKRRD